MILNIFHPHCAYMVESTVDLVQLILQLKQCDIDSDRIKCDIDASFFSSWNRIGICICLRDEDGVYVLAKTMSLSHKHAIEVGEALGSFYAL
jgi:hypothetical protein